MQDERIRLRKTDSARSVNREAFVDVEVPRHTKVFPFTQVSDIIDQRMVFDEERKNSTKYRLILTINPYCSNILFNTVSEIVLNEGTDGTDDKGKLIIANATNPISVNELGDYTVKGKNNNIKNTDMIRNTEYSNGSNGFVYHCGYDIFNNHILRNQTFKLVNRNKNNSDKDVYNTIMDYMRYADGTNVKLYKRNSIDNLEEGKYNRHLYLKDDILTYTDSINVNLTDNNGWLGFYNRSVIPSTEYVSVGERHGWEDLLVSKVFNGKYLDSKGNKEEHSACEFIEMYPDSSLYSFNPKYNNLQNREEQNWDICITYPYENEDSHSLTRGESSDGKSINALLLADYERTIGTSGQNIILFRSLVKHNLKIGDKIKLFYYYIEEGGNTIFVEFKDRLFEITNVGNLDSDYQDYYFYINDTEDIIDSSIKNAIFRFIKVVNDVDCKYYYRKFKKLPNFRIKKEELTKEIAENKTDFEKYVNENCKYNGKMLDFNKEQYQLAFSKTSYNDNNTQVTFTDSIDLSYIVDNLNRPLTELFVTIIKRNKGHNLWYNKNKSNDDLKEIEFSHCFGDVSWGLEVHTETKDTERIRNIRKEVRDATLITKNDASEHTLTNDEDIFYGDVVELNQNDMRETVLSDVQFRFNTEQREHVFNTGEIDCSLFAYDEIEKDDYDYEKDPNKSSFVVKTHASNNDDEKDLTNAHLRSEGYYYKAHYPIKVREFGALRQNAHREIGVASCRPVQAEGLFIEVVSNIRSGANSGNIAYLCDDENGIMIPLVINSVQSSVRFLLNPMERNSENYKTIYDIVNGLLFSTHTITKEEATNGYTWKDKDGNVHIAEITYINKSGETDIITEKEYEELSEDKKSNYEIYTNDENRKVDDYSKPRYILRIKNVDIPNYANKIGNNTYLWRDIQNVGNILNSEIKEYPFANGHFYITNNINFYLKRQDPFGYNGLLAQYKYPNDVYGFPKPQSVYEYKDEMNVVC